MLSHSLRNHLQIRTLGLNRILINRIFDINKSFCSFSTCTNERIVNITVQKLETNRLISEYGSTLKFLLRFDSAIAIPPIMNIISKNPDFELFNFLICTCLENGNLSYAKLLFKEMKNHLTNFDNIQDGSKSQIYEIIIQLLKKSLKSGDFLISEAEEYFSYLEKIGCVTNLAIITMLEMYRQSFEISKAFLLADKYKYLIMGDDSGVLIARLILISSKISDLDKRTQHGTKYITWLKTDATLESRSMCFENLIACFLHNPKKSLEILQFMEKSNMNISNKIKEYFYLQLEIKKMSFTEKSRDVTHANLIEYLNEDTFWDAMHKSSTHIPNNDENYENEHISFEYFTDQFSSNFILSHYSKSK